MTIKVNAHSQMGITRDVAGELFSAKRRKRRGKSSSTESYIKQTPKALARGLVSARLSSFTGHVAISQLG